MQVTHRKNSLYIQLVLLLCGAAVVTGVFFWIVNRAGTYMIERYYLNEMYVEKQDNKYISSLQKYVTVNDLMVSDTTQITQWVKKQGIVTIQIYQNEILVYDSTYPEQADLEDANIGLEENEWNQYYTVEFSDATVRVGIYGSYGYRFYNFALMIELVASFLIFLIIVLMGIRKKMRYILQLSNEIEILEGGNLDYQITVKGKDELSMLALGLDNMRKSFQEQVEQEAKMVQENQRVITEMSHDLRTPITSIMLYTEILKKGAYQDEVQIQEYLDKIDAKSQRMKQLTDSLFKYSLVTSEDAIELEEPEYFETLFFELFSETCSYLMQKGFQVDFQVKWPRKKTQVNIDYVMRVMDNITSNIIKYADREETISICLVEQNGMYGFKVKNEFRALDEEMDSNGIGIQSIKNMMIKMGGKCMTECEQHTFCVMLLFPQAAR